MTAAPVILLVDDSRVSRMLCGAIVRERRASPLGPWHRRMMRLVDEVLDESTTPVAARKT